MISEETNILNEQQHTIKFAHDYVAPEVYDGEITHKNDIYSLGKMICYILKADSLKYEYFNTFIDKDPNKRPTISQILCEICSIFPSYINKLPIKYTLKIQFNKDNYILQKNNKSIYYLTLAANQNHPEAQFQLGLIYYEGQYITRDKNKNFIFELIIVYLYSKSR